MGRSKGKEQVIKMISNRNEEHGNDDLDMTQEATQATSAASTAAAKANLAASKVLSAIIVSVVLVAAFAIAGCASEQTASDDAATGEIEEAPAVIQEDDGAINESEVLASQASFENRGSVFPANDNAADTGAVTVMARMRNLNDNQWTEKNETLIAAQLSCAQRQADKRREDALAKAEADKKAQMAALSRNDVSYAKPHPTATQSASAAPAVNSNAATTQSQPVINEYHQAPDTIEVLGATIPFIDAYNVTRAPEHGAGVWRGDESTTDGKMCYFVGHNPGDFHNVMLLNPGDTVTVCDTAGATRTYTVHDCFTTLQKGTYADIRDRVEGHGESVVMQTCCGDGINIRIVVAY